MTSWPPPPAVQPVTTRSISGAHPEALPIVTVFVDPDGIDRVTSTEPIVFQSAVAGKETVVAVPPFT